MTTTVVNNSVFRGFFEKQKLTGPNFIDWYRQLRIVLSAYDKLNYPEHPIPAAPVPAFVGQQVPLEALVAHAAWVKGQKEIAVLMLMTMELDIQRNLENLGAYNMLQELKTLFSQQVEQERLQTVREFHACKQEEGQSEYDSFVQNYNMHGMGKTVNELRATLKLHDQTLPKKDAPALHAIRAGKSFWDYALESAARILNMVPTKKVENTSYEVWHGKAPKMSYLKVWGCEALVKRDTLTKPDKPRSIKYIGQLRFCPPRTAEEIVARGKREKSKDTLLWPYQKIIFVSSNTMTDAKRDGGMPSNLDLVEKKNIRKMQKYF
ncbi:hypothetical protein Tco_0201033 [Tanacetum coccineum]